MNEQPAADSSARNEAEAWTWVPVRLDLQADEFAEEDLPDQNGSGSTADRILQALREHAVPALYSAVEEDLRLMLPVRTDEDALRLARADEQGKLSTGPELNAFLENLLEDSDLEEVSFSTGEDTADAPVAVAVLRGRIQDVPRYMNRAGAIGWFDVATEPRSPWIVVASEDYDSLIDVVDVYGKEAVVLDTDGQHRAMTLIPDAGESIVLSWGPVREPLCSYPPNSPAGVLQTGGTAPADEAAGETVRVTAVAALAQRFGLDPANERRLSQYTRDLIGKYGPESVLQLLGYPDIAAKILDGRKVLRTEPDYRRFLEEDGRNVGLRVGRTAAAEIGASLKTAATRHGAAALAAVAGAGLSAWALRRRK